MRTSNLPAAGENLFQKIKRQCAEAEKAGINLIKLSIGQPSGPALFGARREASRAVMSYNESMHEYQDNGSPGVPDFAKRFVQAHVKKDLSNVSGVDYLPIPGIKPMLGVVIQAMGGWCKPNEQPYVYTMTNPGYPTPADQCRMNKNIHHQDLLMDPEKGFLPLNSMDELKNQGIQGKDLIMLNFPHNPTGIVAKEEWLRRVCEICEKQGIYIFNDAAYAILNHTPDAVTLTDVATDYPNLNWAEAFSASKAGNFTGWRIGAMVGSPEFMGDIKRIKGNTDSGFAAPLAAGIISLFEKYKEDINAVKNVYFERIIVLTAILQDNGMKPAVHPGAGFFILYDSPSSAFGQKIETAEEFNNLMITNTGVVGVPFGKWIRYAVCTTDIIAFSIQISAAFGRAKVSY